MVHQFLNIYDLVLGVATGMGLLYLLYLHVFVFEYRFSFNVLVFGLLLFVVGGPIVNVYDPTYVHFVHGFAALFSAIGLYGSVYADLNRERWMDLLLQNPKSLRRQGAWMTPMDIEVLELMNDASLVLSPAIIATNLGYSREAVNRRLTQLCEHGYVDRVDRGKYEITSLGEQYQNLEMPGGNVLHEPAGIVDD